MNDLYFGEYNGMSYPLMAALFIGFASFYVVSTIWNDVNNYNTGKAPVINSLLGLAITALGIPLYWYFRRSKFGVRKVHGS